MMVRLDATIKSFRGPMARKLFLFLSGRLDGDRMVDSRPTLLAPRERAAGRIRLLFQEQELAEWKITLPGAAS